MFYNHSITILQPQPHHLTTKQQPPHSTTSISIIPLAHSLGISSPKRQLMGGWQSHQAQQHLGPGDSELRSGDRGVAAPTNGAQATYDQ